MRALLFSFVMAVSTMVHADVCDDLRVELAAAVKSVVSPGAQLFAAFPDGKTCSVSVGIFRTSPNAPMNISSPLKAWSISKTFTHMAILKLVESGHLSLEKNLKDLESIYPNLYQGFLSHYPKSEHITIRQLVSHTSGIVDYMTLPEFLNKWTQRLSPGQIIKIASKHQDKVQPGEVSRYSNTTMMILARIIESITGMKYEDFLQSQFLYPLALHSTYISEGTLGWGPVHGYNMNAQGLFVDATQNVFPELVWGTGAIVSTAADLGKWFASVLTGQVVSAQMTTQIFTPVRLNNGSVAEYGLGFDIQKFPNGFMLIGHGGGPLEGNSATMLYSPQLKTVIVAMANGASANSNAVLGAIGWKRVAEYFQGKE